MAEEMTPEIAAYRMFELGYDCGQTVFANFAEDLDLDEESALRIASAFGGGVAGSGSVCGCVTGALMALGLKYGFSEPNDTVGKNEMNAKGREFMAKFREKCGAVSCRELLGLDVSVPEEAAEISQKGLIPARCPSFVTAACEILEEMLED